MSFLINPFVFAAGGGGGSGPDSISDLELWLKADTLSGSDGDEITTWNDGGPGGHGFTGIAVGAIKPRIYNTAGPNSTKAVLMSDSAGTTGGYFSGDGTGWMNGKTAGHLFVVLKKHNNNNDDSGTSVGIFSSTSEDGYFPYSGDGVIYEPFGTSARKTTANPSQSLADWQLYEIRTASGAWSNWFNGISLFGPVANTVQFGSGTTGGSFGTGNYWVGAGGASGANRPYRGYQREIILYSRVLNSTEIQTIYDYIEDDCGLVLP